MEILKHNYVIRTSSVKERPELITLTSLNDSNMIYYYLERVKDREELWQALTKAKDEYAPCRCYGYCCYIRYRSAVASALMSFKEHPRASIWQYNFMRDMSHIEEVVERWGWV